MISMYVFVLRYKYIVINVPSLSAFWMGHNKEGFGLWVLILCPCLVLSSIFWKSQIITFADTCSWTACRRQPWIFLFIYLNTTCKKSLHFIYLLDVLPAALKVWSTETEMSNNLRQPSKKRIGPPYYRKLPWSFEFMNHINSWDFCATWIIPEPF